MSQKRVVQLPGQAASMVGVALLLLVGLTQAARWAGSYLAPAEESGVPAVIMPEWMAGLASLLMAALCLLVPMVVLQRSGRACGYALHKGRSRVPVWVLLPIFMGVVVLANSVISLLRTLLSLLAGVPAAQSAALPESGVGMFFYFMTVCVVAPVLEELFFRGTVQQMLRFWGARFALLLTAVIFTMMHTSLWDLPVVLVLSLLLGYCYEVSRSVRSCILLHFTNNLSAFLIQLSRQRMETNAAFALILWMMVLFVALFVGSLWAVKYFKLGRRLRLKREPPDMGSIKARLGRILRVPSFAVGALALAVQFIVGLF